MVTIQQSFSFSAVTNAVKMVNDCWAAIILSAAYSDWILTMSICFIKKICEVTLCRTWGFIVMLIWGKTKPRVLATIKNCVVNTVFPIWPIVELPNSCFPNTLYIEYQNVKTLKSKFKGEISIKNKHKCNLVLKEN